MAYIVGWGIFGAVIAMLSEVSVVSAAVGFLYGAGIYFGIFLLLAFVAAFRGYR